MGASKVGSSAIASSAAAGIIGSNSFDECISKQLQGDSLLQCMSTVLQKQHQTELSLIEQNAESNRNTTILLMAALVFFMQAGFAMVCAGSVRRKNLQNTMLKNILDACGATIAFWSIGYAIAFGESGSGDDGNDGNTFIGSTDFFLWNIQDENIVFWVFQYTFSAASATIVAGSLAERCQMKAYFYYSVMLTGWVYPVIVHSVWSDHGFLSPISTKPLFDVGMLDCAGGAVVHVTGGFTALIAAWILGPRRGRFHDVETGEELAVPKEIPGHNVSLQMLGTMILWFGWYGFNCGSAILLSTEHGDVLAGVAAATTTLSGGAAGVTVLFVNFMINKRMLGEGKYDLVKTMNGALGGLVAITTGCALVDPIIAVLIGCIAGVLYLFGSWLMVQIRIDDAVDAVAVHMVNGIWGVIATGLFANPVRQMQAFGTDEHTGFFQTIFLRDRTADGNLLAAQVVGLLFILGWTLVMMLPFFKFLEYRGVFRSDAYDEVAGLDKSFHGGVQLEGENNAYGLTNEQMNALQKRVEHTIRQVDRHDQEQAPPV